MCDFSLLLPLSRKFWGGIKRKRWKDVLGAWGDGMWSRVVWWFKNFSEAPSAKRPVGFSGSAIWPWTLSTWLFLFQHIFSNCFVDRFPIMVRKKGGLTNENISIFFLKNVWQVILLSFDKRYGSLSASFPFPFLTLCPVNRPWVAFLQYWFSFYLLWGPPTLSRSKSLTNFWSPNAMFLAPQISSKR